MPCIPGDSAAISALTRTRVPTCVKVTLPCACDPLAGRITAVADGPSGGVVAHDARNSAQAASLIALFMSAPLTPRGPLLFDLRQLSKKYLALPL